MSRMFRIPRDAIPRDAFDDMQGCCSWIGYCAFPMKLLGSEFLVALRSHRSGRRHRVNSPALYGPNAKLYTMLSQTQHVL